MIHSSARPGLSPVSTITAVLAVLVLGGWWMAPEAQSQAPAATLPPATLAVLLSKLKTQQATIAANQSKIESQTALLKEEIRQAKIYAARGGAGRR